MTSPEEALRQVVPAAVMEVCRRLSDHGYEAWAVGGAVRDALLGRRIGDWDVATSAEPTEVQKLFRRTIPTGIEHGTVTVVVGRGDDRHPIEVTTFRGEGAYSDARRPDEVRFGVPLDEDLARRDLVINAIAYDPVTERLHDPFDGQGDLAARRIRAVGVAEQRFLEDGLRVMRAVRFAAQLEFELDAETEAAIPAALPSLARVAVERVREELHKLLAARRPSLGLVIAQRTGIFGVVLPEIHAAPGDHAAAERFARACARVDAAAAAGRPIAVREAALLVDAVDRPGAERVMRRLKTSNRERGDFVRLIDSGSWWRDAQPSDAELRRQLAAIGREQAPLVLALWRDDGTSVGRPSEADALAAHAEEILAAGHPLSIGELAVRGEDVMSDLGLAPGRIVGDILAALLEQVLDDPSRNQRDQLLALGRSVAAQRTRDG